jgi:hypothetical protein
MNVQNSFTSQNITFIARDHGLDPQKEEKKWFEEPDVSEQLKMIRSPSRGNKKNSAHFVTNFFSSNFIYQKPGSCCSH